MNEHMSWIQVGTEAGGPPGLLVDRLGGRSAGVERTLTRRSAVRAAAVIPSSAGMAAEPRSTVRNCRRRARRVRHMLTDEMASRPTTNPSAAAMANS